MNNTRHTNRFGMVLLLCLTLGVGILFAGCGQAPQVEGKTAPKVETNAPAVKVTPVKPAEKQAKQETATPSASPAPEAKAPEQKPAQETALQPPVAVAPAQTPGQPVATATSEVAPEQKAAQGAGTQLVDLYRSVNEAQASKSKVSSEENAEIEKKWASLLEKSGQPFKMCDEADLVALSLRRPKKASDPHSISLLFRVNKAFKEDYHIIIEASIDPSHVKYLLENDRAVGYARWSLIPEPNTSQWKAKSLSIGGESYILILREMPAGDIPYKINVTFITPDQSSKYGVYARSEWMVPE